MYYVCETQKMLENVVKRSEFVYTREQRYTKVIYYYYYYAISLQTLRQCYLNIIWTHFVFSVFSRQLSTNSKNICSFQTLWGFYSVQFTANVVSLCAKCFPSIHVSVLFPLCRYNIPSPREVIDIFITPGIFNSVKKFPQSSDEQM